MGHTFCLKKKVIIELHVHVSLSFSICFATIYILMLNLINSSFLNSSHVYVWQSYACGMDFLFMSIWMTKSWA
jgi:hypothetical protein